MRTSFLFALLVAAVVADFNYQGNVTVQNNDLVYRDTAAEVLNTGFLAGVLFEATTLIAVNKTVQKDALAVAFFVAPINNDPPTAFVSYYTSFVNYQNAKNNNGNGQNQPFSFSSSQSDTVVTKTFLSLEEVNTTNNITVRTLILVDLKWALLQTTAPTTPAATLSYVSLKGTDPANFGPNFSVTIHGIFSQVVGVLNVVGAPVLTPKSLETVVNILNYPYQSKTNALRLNLVIGTGQVTYTLTKSLTLVSANGTTGANYVTVSNQVVADGNVETATLTVTAQDPQAGTGSTTADFQLTSKYSTQKTVTKVTVQFPAGAANITFDPSAGAGTPPIVVATTTSNNSASSSLVPLFALAIFFAALLF